MIRKSCIFFALALIFFSTSSCKSIDENRIYTKITPELIDIISKYERDASRNPAYSDVINNVYVNNTFAYIEYDHNNPPSAKKISELNYTNVLISLPFQKKEGIVFDSLMSENNIMAMSRTDFESFIKSAADFCASLRKRGIKVYLLINLNKYRFNFRPNIPLFTSAEYRTLSSSGKDNFRDYIIKFHTYLSEKLKLSGIFLENPDFLPTSFWREYCGKMRDYSGRGFLVSFFSKKDPILQELLYSIGVGAVLDYSFTKKIAKTFGAGASLSSLTASFGADALYRNPKRHIVFASLYEKGVTAESLKDVINVFAITMPKIFVLHLDPVYYNNAGPIVSSVNSFKKKYLKGAVNIEHYKDDDLYIYSCTTGYNELLIALNKSSQKNRKAVFLNLKKNKLIYNDISGGPPLETRMSVLSSVISPLSLKVYYVRSRNAVRALNGKRFTESVSYSQTQRDIKIVRFTYRPLKRVKSINLVGDFNNWDTSKTPMIDPDRNGIYEVMLPLPPGKYSYKILIDGKKLVADYAAGVFEDDGNGGRKSVIIVR
jgi:hypothetical protein